MSAALSLSACGSSGRSVAAYCTYFYRQGTSLRNSQEQSSANVNQDPLTAIANVVTAPSQLEAFFDGLAAKAPSSIEPAVEEVAQSYKELADSETKDLMDPLAGMASSLAAGLTSLPADNEVNNWTESNCGSPPGTRWLH